MAGSSYGNIFKVTTWGESHGKGLGVVVDGVPAGLELCEEDIQIFLNRRKPGQSKFTTPRKEDDAVEILSGVFEGKTTGTPVSMVVWNKNQKSKDYSEIASYYRPGHADFCFDEKYGFRDYRGGGRSSGRETIGRVAAGAIAVKMLSGLGIKFLTYTRSIGPVTINEVNFDAHEIYNNSLYMPDADAALKASEYLEECLKSLNSSGGVCECVITGLPVGLGDPVFEKIDANLAKAIMSIGAVKGFEIGSGFSSSTKKGSDNNDKIRVRDGKTVFETNNAGGILGGISNSDQIVFKTYFKPTPSISFTQDTIDDQKNEIQLTIKGRHDPCIGVRAVVVVEAMASAVILDFLLRRRCDRI